MLQSQTENPFKSSNFSFRGLSSFQRLNVRSTLMTLLLTALVSSVGAMLLSPNPAALATSAVVAVLIQCLTWRQLTSSKLWPSHLQPWPYHAGLLAMMIMIAVLIRRQRLAVRGDTVDVATP